MGLTLVTFNAKDLFDTGDPARLERKLVWAAALLERTGWDVLGLQEVGPEPIVRALLARLSDGTSASLVVATADARGIRCALASRRPILEGRVHPSPALDFPVFRVGDPPPFDARVPLRRGIVSATVDGGDLGAIDVFVAHFKSRRALGLKSADGVELEPTTPLERADSELRSLVWRAMESRFLRAAVDDRLSAGAANVVVMGDLNDVPESVTLSVIRSADAGDAALHSAARLVTEARRFSVLHDGSHALIDHVLLTRALFDRITSVDILNGDLRVLGPGEDEDAVDSDHAPLVVRLG
jgi:endonuclease/exonuclease/phosphatase family metal-dependent hydrolase